MHRSRALTLTHLNGSTAIINVICYTCAFPAMACQNVCSEKGIKSHNPVVVEKSNVGMMFLHDMKYEFHSSCSFHNESDCVSSQNHKSSTTNETKTSNYTLLNGVVIQIFFALYQLREKRVQLLHRLLIYFVSGFFCLGSTSLCRTVNSESPPALTLTV